MKRLLLKLLGTKTQCGFCGRKTAKRWPWLGLPRGWRMEVTGTWLALVPTDPGFYFEERDIKQVRCYGCEK